MHAGHGVQLRIVQGYAQCLADSLCSGPAAEPTAEAQGEDRAGLILRLLQLACQQPAPNLAHMLLGYDISAGPQGARLECCTKTVRQRSLLQRLRERTEPASSCACCS